MKTLTKKGLVLAGAFAVFGALALAPRPGHSADSGVDKNSPEYQRAYRDAYNKSYSEAQAAEQKKIEEEESEQQSGCCG